MLPQEIILKILYLYPKQMIRLNKFYHQEFYNKYFEEYYLRWLNLYYNKDNNNNVIKFKKTSYLYIKYFNRCYLYENLPISYKYNILKEELQHIDTIYISDILFFNYPNPFNYNRNIYIKTSFEDLKNKKISLKNLKQNNKYIPEYLIQLYKFNIEFIITNFYFCSRNLIFIQI